MALEQGKKASATGANPGKSGPPAAQDRDVGRALRTVYDETVNEAVPAEMLDLLGRLD